jgi:hypothetical protein
MNKSSPMIKLRINGWIIASGPADKWMTSCNLPLWRWISDDRNGSPEPHDAKSPKDYTRPLRLGVRISAIW